VKRKTSLENIRKLRKQGRDGTSRAVLNEILVYWWHRGIQIAGQHDLSVTETSYDP
jgi:hypothetical protein